MTESKPTPTMSSQSGLPHIDHSIDQRTQSSADLQTLCNDIDTTFRRLAATNPTIFQSMAMQSQGLSEQQCLKLAITRLYKQLFEYSMNAA